MRTWIWRSRAPHKSAWVTYPNSDFDPKKGAALYNRYLDELELAAELGFDAVSVNEHHQSAYGLMPSPVVMAAALARRTERCKLAILGNAFALREHPLTLAEEHAMIDCISGGRLITGFVRGIGAEFWSLGANPTTSHERHVEAHDLIVRAWTETGPFAFEGKHFHFEYVNVWPRPYPTAAPADLVPVAGLDGDHRMGRPPRPALCLSAELQPVRVGEPVPQLLPRDLRDQVRVCRLLGTARLDRAGLCGRHR